MSSRLYVIKRGMWTKLGNSWLLVALFFLDGREEGVMFDKITSRINKLCYGLNNDFVEPVGDLNGTF